jgi:hypothetical protein
MMIDLKLKIMKIFKLREKNNSYISIQYIRLCINMYNIIVLSQIKYLLMYIKKTCKFGDTSVFISRDTFSL